MSIPLWMNWGKQIAVLWSPSYREKGLNDWRSLAAVVSEMARSALSSRAPGEACAWVKQLAMRLRSRSACAQYLISRR